MYPYAFIGNCQVSALISKEASIDWLCMPRPDSAPTFGRLLDPDGGHFKIELTDLGDSEQWYRPNTNIVETKLSSTEGALLITDFCPRFEQFGRMYRPASLFRRIIPLTGTPRIKVDLRAVDGWSKRALSPSVGNSHLRYDTSGSYFRLLTSMSLTYLGEQQFFALREPLYFALTWASGLEDDLARVYEDFLLRTERYWKEWVKNCRIPSEFQKESIRSALALKIHCYEDTGAILASPTTSLPEECGSERNWDYRYCWLRDSYFVLSAFHKLGLYQEMEHYLGYILDLTLSEQQALRPVYTIDRRLPLPEVQCQNWSGFAQSKPVRVGNDAANHVQNDIYGEAILSIAPIYLDERFESLRTAPAEALLSRLTRHCSESIGSKDAGPWELRSNWQEHSFTNLMSWAGLTRVRRILDRGFSCPTFNAQSLIRAKERLELALKDGSIRAGTSDSSFDSSALLLPVLGWGNRAQSLATVEALHQILKFSDDQPAFLYRYKKPDDFGKPRSAFLICSFWYIQALAALGQIDPARLLLQQVLASANHLQLLSEHYDPLRKEQLGNFPQAYSHVGQIHAAFSVSPAWEQVL